MTFVALDNLKTLFKRMSSVDSLTLTDMDGNSKGLTMADQYNNEPFPCYAGSPTSPEQQAAFPYATSNASVPTSTTAVTNQVGNAEITYAKTSKGWTAAITITGTADATIRSILFAKKFRLSSNYYNALIYAVILDNPVELNSGNNYTANFVFSIEF